MENEFRNVMLKVVGKRGVWIQVVVKKKDGREVKMVMREVKRFWGEEEKEEDVFE